MFIKGKKHRPFSLGEGIRGMRLNIVSKMNEEKMYKSVSP
jgi:hypothetical protein